MKNKNELSINALKMTCPTNLFKFETTKELEPIQSGIGQDRGIKALEFGLQVEVKGYNLYLEGPSGVGKTMYTRNYLEKIAPKKIRWMDLSKKYVKISKIHLIMMISRKKKLSLNKNLK